MCDDHHIPYPHHHDEVQTIPEKHRSGKASRSKLYDYQDAIPYQCVTDAPHRIYIHIWYRMSHNTLYR